jgi:hypothetical protein
MRCLARQRKQNLIKDFTVLMEIAGTSKTSLNFHQTTQSNNLENSHRQKTVFTKEIMRNTISDTISSLL